MTDVSRLHERKVRVAIIGAGISGIAAGNFLMSEGYDDFVIIESTNRVGGRIWSIDLETDMGHRIELGANWIHGNPENPIYEIAMANNLLSTQYEGRHLGKKMIFLTESGDPINPKIVHDVDFSYGMLMAECEDFYKNQIPTPCENDSVGAFVQREFEEKIQRFHGREHRLREMIFEQRLLTDCMITGADSMNNIALSEVGCFEDLPGVHYVIPPGFETVIEILKRNIPPSNILLERRVSRMAWKQEGSGCEAGDNSEPAVRIECVDGTKILADICLVTVSLGYLKAHATRLFDPPLPEYKTDAISRVAMGTVNKIILEFDSQILPDGVFRLEMVWDRSLDTNGLEENWVKKIGFFEAVSDNVLIGWLSGKEAEYTEKLSEEEIGRVCTEAIAKFMSKTTRTLPKLKKVTRTMWKSNVDTLGSYCHIPVGATAEDIINLGEPVTDASHKLVFLFAGEATHPRFYSSAHGALLSGRREAQRILGLVQH